MRTFFKHHQTIYFSILRSSQGYFLPKISDFYDRVDSLELTHAWCTSELMLRWRNLLVNPVRKHIQQRGHCKNILELILVKGRTNAPSVKNVSPCQKHLGSILGNIPARDPICAATVVWLLCKIQHSEITSKLIIWRTKNYT